VCVGPLLSVTDFLKDESNNVGIKFQIIVTGINYLMGTSFLSF
jgi:hypothetical protein